MVRAARFAAFFVVMAPATADAWDHHHHHVGGDHSSSSSGCSHKPDEVNDTPETPTETGSPPAPSAAPKHVFYTSFVSAGDLGGVTGADALCNRAGAQAGLVSSHAYLATSSENAVDRVVGAGPFYSTAGHVVFATRADIPATPRAAITDETGVAPTWAGSAHVWTGTDAVRRATGNDCADWSTSSSLVEGELDNGSPAACSQPAALLCFEE